MTTTTFNDVDITCVDCGNEFVWTTGEQQFFKDKGLTNQPRRCKSCKQAKNERIGAASNTPDKKEKVETTAQCAQCGNLTTVPFFPSQGRPVYCRPCFQGRQRQ